jgi:hypothetical protein
VVPGPRPVESAGASTVSISNCPHAASRAHRWLHAAIPERSMRRADRVTVMCTMSAIAGTPAGGVGRPGLDCREWTKRPESSANQALISPLSGMLSNVDTD